MNYPETLDYLYNTLPLFSRMGSAAFKKDLTNIRLLCASLHHPEKKFRTIHVGGTNGKGSVSHMLAAAFQASGYKTGLYTSPHLYDFRERIRMNGLVVDEAFVVSFVENIRPLMEEIQPSFFEITVAMAFSYFAQQQVDIAVIEVGLGGRLDSTNIINPELSVITNIGWDHMNMLGDSLQAIAAEKAGIIKQGIPVVIGEEDPETAGIFRAVAAEKQAPLLFATDAFSVEGYVLKPAGISISLLEKASGRRREYALDLPGIYQTRNVCTVLAALAQLPGWKTEPEVVREALLHVRQTTGLHGRWELIAEQPAVVLEVAHNKEGIEQMLQHLQHLRYRQLHLVFGMVRDKDASTILSLLPRDAQYYFTQAHIPRALDAAGLQQQAATFHLKGNHFSDVNQALQAALQQAAENDLVIVCGSIFLVAEVDKESIAKRP